MRELAARFLLFENYFPHLGMGIELALKTSAIVMLGLAFTAFLRNRTAAVRCWIWRAAFLGLLALGLFEFAPWAVRRMRPEIRVPVTTETGSAFMRQAQSLRMVPDNEELNRREERRRQQPLAAVAKPPWEQEWAVSHFDPTNYQAQPWRAVEGMVSWVWGIGAGLGVLIAVLRTAVGLVLLRRRSAPAGDLIAGRAEAIRAQMKIKRRLEVRTSGAVDSPVLFGVMRPLIYFPTSAAGWDEEKLSSVFLHELAHWKRHDFLWFQFGGLMVCLFWWNPLVRLAMRRMSMEGEEAADDIVLLRKPEADAYARALVEIAAEQGAAGNPLGLSMLGYRSMEQRIRRMLKENHWRGRVGKMAATAVVMASLAIAGLASIYLGIASEGSGQNTKRVTLTAAQREIAQRIIDHTKKRITALRFTHVKVERSFTEESKGKTAVSPQPEKLEEWNDLWTGIHLKKYTPQVMQWSDGAAPFYIRDTTEIDDGTREVSIENGTVQERKRLNTRNGDALEGTLAGDLVNMLTVMPMVDSSEWHGTLVECDWHGQKAVRYQDQFLPNGKVTQQRTFIVLPDKKDMICYWELSFPGSRPETGEQWTAEDLGQAANGEYYPRKFTSDSLINGDKTVSTFTVSLFEALTELPKGLARIPDSPGSEFVAKAGRAQPHQSLTLEYVDEANGKPVPGVAVKVRINGQAAVTLRTDSAGDVRIPLPKEEITYLSAGGRKTGYAGKFVQWRKYGDVLQIPETYRIKMGKGAAISGRVVDEGGKPIGGATVGMYLYGRWVVFAEGFSAEKDEVKTDEKGGWTLPDYPADLSGLSYRISCPGYEATTDSGVADFRTSTGLSYAALRDGSLVITLKHGAELRGRITDAAGKPVPKCKLTVGKDIWGTNCPETESGADGTYAIKGLGGGKVWLTVEASNHKPLAREIALPVSGALDFVLQEGNVIRGHVTMPNGAPCAGLNVGVDTWNKLRTLRFGTQTDTNGNFTWAGAPDEAVTFFFGGCQNRESLAGLWLKPSGGIQEIVIKPGLHLSGSVVDARTGTAIRSFKLTPGNYWSPSDINWEQESAQSFTEGKFDWKTNWMGEWHVFKVEAPGYKPFQTEPIEANLTEASQVVSLTPE